MRRAAVLMIVVAACTSEPDVVRYNAGNACLQPDHSTSVNEPHSFTAGAAVIVSVSTSTGACDTDRRTECSIERNGATLHIASVASWSRPEEQWCTREAVPLTATCTTDSLDAGEYAVTFGDASVVLVVPSTVARPCMWNAGDSVARDW